MRSRFAGCLCGILLHPDVLIPLVPMHQQERLNQGQLSTVWRWLEGDRFWAGFYLVLGMQEAAGTGSMGRGQGLPRVRHGWLHNGPAEGHSRVHQWSHLSQHIFKMVTGTRQRSSKTKKWESTEGRLRLEEEEKMPCQGKIPCSPSRSFTGAEKKCEEEVVEKNCCVLTITAPCSQCWLPCWKDWA